MQVFFSTVNSGFRSFQFYQRFTAGLCHAYLTSFCMTAMADCELNCRLCQFASQFSTNRVDEDLFCAKVPVFCWNLLQAWKQALIFPTFLICYYFSLLFLENALISLLLHSKMSFTCKIPEFFPRLLRFYEWTHVTFREHAAKHLNFNPKSRCFARLPQLLSCLFSM